MCCYLCIYSPKPCYGVSLLCKMLSEVDFDFICRVCLTYCVEMMHISHADRESLQNTTVKELLRKCASVQVEEGDELPQYVCLKCIGKLHDHISFEELVKNSDTALRDYLISDNNQKDSSAKSISYQISDNGTEELIECADTIKITSDDTHLKKKNDISDGTNKEYIGVHPNTMASILSDHRYTVNFNLGNKPTYQCKDCSLIFKTRRKYQQHVQKHRRVIYQCEKCPKSYTSLALMIRHNRAHSKKKWKPKKELSETNKNQQNKIEPKKQTITPSSSNNTDTKDIANNSEDEIFKQPIPKPKKPRKRLPFPCYICGKVLNSRNGLIPHIRTHTGERPHMCHLCGKSFAQTTHLKRHQLTHSGVKSSICEICGKQFPTISLLKHHLLRHTQTPKRYLCSQCPKTFLNPSTLSTHVLVVHQGERFKCFLCEQDFTSRKLLNTHLEKEHTDCSEVDRENPFPCDKCARSFKVKYHLEAHSVIHKKQNNNSDSECLVCGKVFANRVCLRMHALRHGPSRIHQCHLCNRSFNDPEVLKAHVRFHERRKPFECSTCHKRFLDKSALRVHNRTHTGEKLFGCDICKKRFTVKKSLDGHLRRHYGILPYACIVCPKKFAAQGTLNTHMLMAHKIG